MPIKTTSKCHRQNTFRHGQLIFIKEVGYSITSLCSDEYYAVISNLWPSSKQECFLNHRLGKYFLSFPTNWNFGNTIIHHCIGLWIIHFGEFSIQTCDLNVDAEMQCIDKLRILYCDAFSSEIIKFACTDFRTPLYNVFERRCSNKISIRNEK